MSSRPLRTRSGRWSSWPTATSDRWKAVWARPVSRTTSPSDQPTSSSTLEKIAATATTSRAAMANDVSSEAANGPGYSMAERTSAPTSRP